MKALTIVAALALTSGSAMALDTVMGLKGRFDYVRTETDNNPGKDSSGVLTTSYLRLVTDAKLNDTMTAKLTLDFQEANSSKDNGLTNFVYEAFLTKDFGHGISAMVGKQAVLTGGHENEYSSRDVYSTSVFNDNIADNLMGLTAGYSVAEQNIYLQYLQQTDTAQTPFTDKKVVGAAYYGSFMNKMIEPVLSYHKQGTTRAGQYDTFMSAGLRLNVAQFTVEADYLVLEQEKLSAAGDAKLNSIVATVRYNHENFKPFAKFIKEDGEKGFDGIVTGSNESERTAWELGLEFVPNKDEDFRYHVVYANSESKETKPASSKTEEQKIYAGIAFNYNILK